MLSKRRQSFYRVVRLGVVNFWRNRWLTLGATLLMTLTLTMISASLLMTFLLRDSADSIRSRIDITIYFRDDAVEDAKLTALASRIKKVDHVLEVKYLDKKEALSIFNRLPINEEIKKPVSESNNPLPRSVLVDTDDPDQIPAIIKGIESVDSERLICGECVSYVQNQNTVNQLISATRFAQRAGIFLSLFFGIIAIFNVYNIIKITISARSDEIEVMRYVGASNMFVRGPFMVEGVLYGVFGTLLTTLFLLVVSRSISAYAAQNGGNNAVSSLQLIGIDVYGYLLKYLGLLVVTQLVIGVVLGVLVSIISLRRYLKA